MESDDVKLGDLDVAEPVQFDNGQTFAESFKRTCDVELLHVKKFMESFDAQVGNEVEYQRIAN